jgi:quercetin dioxygenase-like cupin family protein
MMDGGCPMFYQKTDSGYKEPMKGVRLKALVHGDKTMLAEFVMRKGKSVPSHKHPHEQTGYLVSGHIRLAIGEEVFEARSGDSWCIPGDVEHSALVVEDAVAIEVFSPPREDYLP